MLHSKHITVTKSTTSSNPVRSSFIANIGIISNIWITFPNGCNNLVKLRVYHQGHPFLPVEVDAYITGNNFTFVYPIFYEITDQPEIITVEAWNEDDTYDHIVDIQFLIVDKEYIMPIGAYEGIIAAFSKMFSRRPYP